jgi:hypothetical protein
MNVVLVLLKLCFPWLAPVETVRVIQTLTRSPMNPMALLVMPVRLQLARIHPPPLTRKHH